LVNSKKKSLLLASRCPSGQGKKFEFLAKIGWRVAPEFGRIADWQRLYEKIRTEFKENF